MGFDGPDMDALKQQTTVEWGRTVQNLTRALLKSKRRQRGLGVVETMEKLRHRQIALKEQAREPLTVSLAPSGMLKARRGRRGAETWCYPSDLDSCPSFVFVQLHSVRNLKCARS